MPLPEELHHLAEQPAGELRTMCQKLVRIDAVEGDVLAEGPQAQTAAAVEVALAELQEAAEGSQDLQAALHGLAGQRVQDDVDALAAGDLHDLVGKLEAAGI